jgi:hypothetical protein
MLPHLIELEAAPSGDVHEPVDGQPGHQVGAVAAADEAGHFERGRRAVSDEFDAVGQNVWTVVTEAVGLPFLEKVKLITSIRGANVKSQFLLQCRGQCYDHTF